MQRFSGLYAITNQPDDTPILLEQTERALQGGANIVQYREKSSDNAKRLREAKSLLKLCHNYQIPLIINDDIELANSVGADGVHLGHGDASLREARRILGDDRIIGISCYNEWARAEQAANEGADYVAFGAFYPSKTKPRTRTASLTLLSKAKRELNIPVVAIGGINLHNAAPLLEAGADVLAVINGLFGQSDIQATAKAFSTLFDQFRC